MGNETTIAVSAARSEAKAIASNFSMLFAGESLSKALAFLAGIYLARVLGVDGFGKFSYVWVFITYGMLVSDIGLNGYGTREVARDGRLLGMLVSNISAIRLSSTTVIYALACALGLALAGATDMTLLFVFTFLWLFPHSVALDWAYRGLEKMGYASAWNLIHQAVFIVLLLVFVRSYEDLLLVPLCKVAGAVAASFFQWAVMLGRGTLLRGHGFLRGLDASRWPSFLKVAVPMGGTYAMILVISNFDVIMLGIMKDASVVGWYSAGYNVVLVFGVLVFLITSSFYPRLSNAWVADRASYTRLFRSLIAVSGAVGFAASAAILLLAPYIIPPLLGDEYVNTIAPLQVLAPVIFLSFIATAMGSSLNSAGFERVSFVVVSLGAVTNILLNIALIPRFSMLGAAVATNISYMVIIVGYLASLRRTLMVPGRTEQAGRREGR